MKIHPELDVLVEEVLRESRLPGPKREELRKELESHMWDTALELRDQGMVEAEIVKSAAARFGAPKGIAQSMSYVHGSPLTGLLKFCLVLLLIPFPLAGILGFLRLSTIFGQLFLLPGLVLVVWAVMEWRYGKIKTASVLALTAAGGQWLAFLSWIASRRSVPEEQSTPYLATDLPIYAKAGFPVSALELPHPPLGNDNVPVEMWTGAFANQLFWLVIAAAIAWSIAKRSTFTREKLIACGIIAFLGVMYNLAMFTLWYD